jgi:hypothetical protein
MNDPGTATNSAKNKHTVPGLPNQSNNHSGRTPMVAQDLILRACARTRHRVELVTAPVEIIARRCAAGETNQQITAYLQSHLGPESAVASLDFVTWVVAQIRWQELDQARKEQARGGAR